MARAVHTFNTDSCDCGQDHDQIFYLVGAVLAAIDRGALPDNGPAETGHMVQRAAEMVGWVKAGDELEDLRSLVGDLTGIDQIDLDDLQPGEGFTAKPVNSLDDDALKPQNMLLSFSDDKLYIAKPAGNALRAKDDQVEVIFTVHLDEQTKRVLVEQIQDSYKKEEDDSE